VLVELGVKTSGVRSSVNGPVRPVQTNSRTWVISFMFIPSPQLQRINRVPMRASSSATVTYAYVTVVCIRRRAARLGAMSGTPGPDGSTPTTPPQSGDNTVPLNRERPKVRMTGQERRSQLLDIGRAVFAERGFEAASIEEVAQRAQITKPVVYEHFGGKEGLYAVIVDREVRNLLARITAALDADHPRLMLEQAALGFLSYIAEESDGFRILVRDSPVTGTTGTLASLIGDIASQVEYVLAQEFGNRGFDPELAPLYSQALCGMIALVGQWWLDAGTPSKEEVAAQLVNLAWNGLKDLEHLPQLISMSSRGRRRRAARPSG
jgi:AcrR family transcriptional regulator